MRTTLDIDDDVLLAARDLADRRGSSLGRAVSDLARQGLTRTSERRTRNGIPLLPVRTGGPVVTMELVNRLRDEAP
ncbi:MAG: CopG family transcriptional regulator [Chloroflexi bacterium]|nr:CopG family transcriptional regulator [Chloroflexota bacterium]